MRTRMLNTKVWIDPWFCGLSIKARYLFLYLITTPFMGFTGYAELSDRQILFDTGFTKQELRKYKKELSPKVLFVENWVYVVNLLKYDPIPGKDNNIWKAHDKEKSSIPTKIIDLFDRELPSPSKGFKGLQSPPKGKRNGKGKVKARNSKGRKLIKKKREELGL